MSEALSQKLVDQTITPTMKLLVFVCVGFMYVKWSFAATISSDALKEAHIIKKRLADSDQEFTTHDIAQVLEEREPGSFHRISRRDLKSVTEIDNAKRIRLDLSSGSTLHLNLIKRSLFDSDTKFYTNTEKGPVKREAPVQDCYATGNVEVDGETDGMATVAMCDGLHGSALSNGVEYYIHPVEDSDGLHQVHVLTRRTSEFKSAMNNDHQIQPNVLSIIRQKREAQGVNPSNIVIEMAIFTDAEYNKRIKKVAPGREDELILMNMAGVQAVYSNKENVGYDVLIKVKLFMNWIVDPDGYVFTQDISLNNKALCEATRDEYHYDMHFHFTGITQSVKELKGVVGYAYLSAVCSRARCACSISVSPNQIMLIAHEIGHNLGLYHHEDAVCPDAIKKLGGGFMYGGDPLRFSPCNKWELQELFNKGLGQCLFEETRETKTPKNYVNLPSVLPVQNQSPDEQCKTLAGKDYQYYRPYDIRGNGECTLFMCINLNKNSPEYMRVVIHTPKKGFTCGDEMFCQSEDECIPWDDAEITWDVGYLRANKQLYSWSKWSNKWSACSHKCGTGVQVKRRRCLFQNMFLSPHCRGPSVHYRPCNTHKCKDKKDLRQIQGDEICKRFFDNNVPLENQKGFTYLPKSKDVWFGGNKGKYMETMSCMFHCERTPDKANHVLDGIYPDGVPCTDSKKPERSRQQFNIELRCVDGVCKEFSDCPGNEEKDMCGICGGDIERCVDKVVDQSTTSLEGETVLLAKLPAGTTNININMEWWNNKGVRLELYTQDGKKILGEGSKFPNKYYVDEWEFEYSGTKWSYNWAAFIRADGPIERGLVVKAHRGSNSIQNINVIYLKPESNDGEIKKVDKCANGACKKITECKGEETDVCGACGKDHVRCVTKVVDQSTTSAKGETVFLAKIPAGTTNIDINMEWWKNKGVRLELYKTNGEKIFGEGGKFPNTYYVNEYTKEYAGTEWSYNWAAFIRADGPIKQGFVVKAHRGSNPIENINVNYLKPDTKNGKVEEIDKCANGACKKIKECKGKKTDVCGACGKDHVRCITKVVDQSTTSAKGETVFLAKIPAGTTNIDINMVWWNNKGVRLELYKPNGEKIFGEGGKFPNTYYVNDYKKEYAGTEWSYNWAAFIRADGPIEQGFVVKAHRGSKSIDNINVIYLKPKA